MNWLCRKNVYNDSYDYAQSVDKDFKPWADRPSTVLQPIFYMQLSYIPKGFEALHNEACLRPWTTMFTPGID